MHACTCLDSAGDDQLCMTSQARPPPTIYFSLPSTTFPLRGKACLLVMPRGDPRHCVAVYDG